MKTLKLLQPPTLNKTLNSARTNKYLASNEKKLWTSRAKKAALLQLTPFADDAKIRMIANFEYISTASDTDNMISCLKYIMDGIETAGIIKDDSIKTIVSPVTCTFTKIPSKTKKYATIRLFDDIQEWKTYTINLINEVN